MTFRLDHDVPEDLSYSLEALGHRVVRLRDVMPPTAKDEDVLQRAASHHHVLITCNRDDFVGPAKTQPHHGTIVLIRRKTRIAERVALVNLLDRAGDTGIVENINFA